MRFIRLVGIAMVAVSLSAAPARASVLAPVSSHAVGWGWNKHGQLGNGATAIAQTTFVEAGALPQRFTKVAAGQTHSLAVAADRTVWSWGRNSSGQLGDGTTTPRLSPGPVPGLSDVVEVEAGSGFSLALRADGSVWAWGNNSRGQLGQGDAGINRPTPVQVPGLWNVVDIEAATAHVLAVKSDATVWAWGDNEHGQLGLGSYGDFLPDPRSVPGMDAVTGAAAGEGHSLVVRSDGRVWAWGNNSSGQLGDHTDIRRTRPILVPGVSGFVQVAAGASHSLALLWDGTVWSWGANWAGQLGTGDFADRPAMDRVRLGGVTRIDAGEDFSLARREPGQAWSWGANGIGQLGDGTQTDRAVPVRVTGLENVLAVAASAASSHALAVRSVPPPAPPQVRIDLDTEGGVVPAGGSLTVNVGTTAINGPTKIVMSVSGLPHGVTAAFNPGVLISGGSSALTLTAGPQASTGWFTLTVTATAASHTATATYELNVTDPAG
ncbi:hypothetical protein Aph01nite_22810 [Acrocarpospora phusangensis]|uniref:RCC1-like domain-containing protein n=1 Tax=Acrocarpospora phusangensis TaxID=1070424 RepID=A0A919UJL3_9ACTN|nr:hypothetical protein [Acrocarpospora phusangensis]GIH23971.1 hypothetical protein Aph01nite_22810 [Acrocarpospora phusangensis]